MTSKSNDARLPRALVRFVMLTAVFVGGYWLGAWSISQDVRKTARQNVERALALSAPNASLEALRPKLGIPRALKERDDAIVHYLLMAREVEEGRDTGANYFLALHYLTRDCVLAAHYLREQIRVNDSDPRVREMLRTVETGGCAAASLTRGDNLKLR